MESDIKDWKINQLAEHCIKQSAATHSKNKEQINILQSTLSELQYIKGALSGVADVLGKSKSPIDADWMIDYLTNLEQRLKNCHNNTQTLLQLLNKTI